MSWSDIISLTITIVLGLISIAVSYFAKKAARDDADRSAKAMEQAKELLSKVSDETLKIQHSMEVEQNFHYNLMNKMLDKMGAGSIDMEPMTAEEISSIVDSEMKKTVDEVENIKRDLEKGHNFFMEGDDLSNVKNGDIVIRCE